MKSKFGKIAIMACAVVSIAVLSLASLCACNNSQDLGKKDVKDETANIQIAIAEQHQMFLSVATTAAENGELKNIVYATVTPADAYNKLLDWTIEWKSGNSWAIGKNIEDYLTFGAFGSNASSAEVICKQAFGCQAILKATSTVQPDVYATCTIDYTKRVTNLDAQRALCANGSVFNKFSLSEYGLGIAGSNEDAFHIDLSNALTKSIGTIEPTVSVAKVEVKISEAVGIIFYDQHIQYAYEYVTLTAGGTGFYDVDSWMDTVFSFDKNSLQTSEAQAIINGLLNSSSLSTDVLTFRITLSNGGTGEAHYGLTIDDSALLQPANVALSPNSLVF